MSGDPLPRKLKDALLTSVEKASDDEAIQIARKCVDVNVEAEELIESISEAFKVIGEKYERGEYYLPELMFAGTLAQKVLALLNPMLSRSYIKPRSKVVMGTVRGDLHDLGKNIVAMMLKPAGFEVIDLGVDVSPENFSQAVKVEKASVLCLSSLLSTTRNEMITVIEKLKRDRLRDKVKVVVGGGAVSEEFAKEIGADAYGKDAMEAVSICKRMTGG